MATVYILKGSTGRHYIGCTENFNQRLAEHQRGSCHTTKRLGLPLALIAKLELNSLQEAYKLERALKNMKNPTRAIQHLESLR